MKIENISHLLPTSGNYQKRTVAEITDLVIHHSAASPHFGAKDFAQWHLEQGWHGIGYHFVIDAHGNIQQTNELTAISYHVGGHNSYCLGICLSGDFNKAEPTKKQMKAVVALCRNLAKELPSISQLNGHGHYKSTSCPGSQIDVDYIRSKTFSKRNRYWLIIVGVVLIFSIVAYLILKKK